MSRTKGNSTLAGLGSPAPRELIRAPTKKNGLSKTAEQSKAPQNSCRSGVTAVQVPTQTQT